MATDQEIRDAGFKYVPQQKYLLNPFVLPEDQEPVVNQGIVNTNAFTGGGGDNFSVYNPDPNSIVNRKYDPRPYYDATYEDTFGTNLGDPAALTATGAEFYEPPPSKLEGLMSMVPYVGNFVRGAKFLGDQISPYLPVNRRSIMENQLSGKGIMVNNIGQIVSGNSGSYYDPSGANIMAGYNAYHVDQETFDKRRAKAKEKMSPEGFKKFNIALTAAETDFLDAQGKTDTIYDFEEEEKKKKKKDTIIGRFITKKKEAKATKDAKDAKDAAAAAAAPAMQPNTFIPPSGKSGGDDKYDYVGRSNKYGIHDATKTKEEAATTRESYRGKDGGRVKYFFGGRVGFKNGGLASIL